jgi:hypothetical protein
MNKIVLSALALTTAGSLAAAGTGSEEWLTLDKEIESLSTTLAPQGTGLTVNGFIASSWVSSGDIQVGTNDLGGFNMDNIRLSVTGSVGDFTVYVSADGSSSLVPGTGTTYLPVAFGSGGAFGVLDAYAAWNINEMLRLTMGQFYVPFVGNGNINENNMLFMNHTTNGVIGSTRDTGLMLNGQYDMFGFWVALMNGGDLTGNEYAYNLRGEFYAMGGGAGSTVEGAYGSAQGHHMTIGAGYYNDDGAIPDDIAFSLDATFTSGPISAYAEIVDFDNGAYATNVVGATLGGNRTAWSLQGGFMFVPEKWEAALRYEDLDTTTSTAVITVGVNYYMGAADTKWQLNYSSTTDDVSANEFDWFGIGLVASV